MALISFISLTKVLTARSLNEMLSVFPYSPGNGGNQMLPEGIC